MTNPNAGNPVPDINQDLEAQHSLAGHLAGRIIGSSRLTEPYGVGDDKSFDYATQIFGETQWKIGELEGHDPEQLTGRADKLRAHVDDLKRAGEFQSRDSISAFNNTMTNLLTERLDAAREGFSPGGFVMATTLLTLDAARGINGHTREPMPSQVTDYAPMAYGLFAEVEAPRLAKGAFGDQFGYAVEAINKNRRANNAKKTNPDEPRAA
ncbi:MAG TPA: hypothetical protein VNG32_04120 [Candidatus Dormibacteraeota bacterium]|nr:hypothetical protein [Candidatus Dormibacteraeota bacterium]